MNTTSRNGICHDVLGASHKFQLFKCVPKLHDSYSFGILIVISTNNYQTQRHQLADCFFVINR